MDPGYYMPFVMRMRRGQDGPRSAAALAAACGAAHVACSLLAGMAGWSAGFLLGHFLSGSDYASRAAAWTVAGLGVAYAGWGIEKARGQPPDGHTHGGGVLHSYDHIHDSETGESIELTPAVLLALFSFSPCWPLAALLLLPASRSDGWEACRVAVCFGVVTLATLAALIATHRGADTPFTARYARYGHAIAGVALALAGGSIGLSGA